MSGFTLIELLVAILIFALIATAGVSLARFVADNQAVVRARAERLAALERTRAILKQDLSQAADRRVRDVDGRAQRGPFQGGAEQGTALLRFTRRGWENPDGAPRASLQHVEYRFKEGRLERVARLALDGGEWAAPQVLIDQVRAARLQFLWRNQWIGTLPGGPDAPLPQAVRLDLVLTDWGSVTQLFAVTGRTQ